MPTANYMVFDIEGDTGPKTDITLHPDIEVDVFDEPEAAPKKPPRITRKESGIPKYITEEIAGVGSTVLGMGETAASMLTGWAGMVPAGFTAIGEKLYQAFGGDISDEEIASHINYVQQSWTYDPKSKEGKIMVDALGKGIEKGREWAADKAYNSVYKTQKNIGKTDSEARKAAILAQSETEFGIDYLLAVMPLAGIKGRGKPATEQPTKPGEPPTGEGPTASLEGELIRPGERPTEPQLEAQPKPPLEGEVVRSELPAPKEARYTVMQLEEPTKALPAPEQPKASVTDSGSSVTDSAVMERKRLAKETEKSVEVEELPLEEISVGRTEPAQVLDFTDRVRKNKQKLEDTSALKEGDALHKTESELGAEMDIIKPPNGPDIGLSIKRTVEDAPAKTEIPDKAVETFFKETKGEKKIPFKERASDFIISLGHKISRTYEHLPNTAEFAEAKYGLKKLEKSKGIVSDRTVRLIDSVTYDLGPNNYDIFRKKLVLDDLAFTGAAGKPLPRGFTPEQIQNAKGFIDQSIARNPKVLRALEKRRQVWDSIRQDVIKAYGELGINIDNVFNNPDYFRHLILDKANANIITGTGAKLKVPRGRGYTKKRKGSELDFNTEYIQAEYEVLAGLLNDINIAKTVKLIDKTGNIRQQLEAQFGKEWSKNIPEGYVVWRSDPGHALHLQYTIPESIAEQMFMAASEQLGIPKETLVKDLTLRRDSPNMVIREELAITLDNLIKSTKDHPFVAADKSLTRGWKIWTLTQPRRLAKYNIRNFTGDMEAAFIGNPSTFTQMKASVGELYDVMVSGKAPSETLRAWLDRGGMQSTLQAAELGDINRLALFKRLQDKKGTLAEIPEKIWQGYWKTARLSTDFREAILRYAAFRDYIEQMKANPEGKPRNYGASIREEVDALPNLYDRADKLSNDLLGNYTEVSVAGQAMRDHVFPFWSFQEINFKRYFRFIDNAIQAGELPELVGRKLTGTVAKSPLMVARAGIVAMKMAALWSALEIYNNTFFSDEEDELPNYIQDGPHIVFGRNSDGSVNYFGNLGLLGDFVTWFGMNAAPKHVRDWYAGRKGIGEIAIDTVKEPVNKFAGGSFPFIKLAYEEVTGTSIYPNMFEPTHIRNKGRYFAKFLGLEKEYDSISGAPALPYAKTLPSFLYYSINSGEAAYSNIYQLKKSYLRRIGKGHEGYLITPASNALYNFKLAIKYKDSAAADKYLAEYVNAGGNIKGVITSVQNMHPLAGIPEELIPDFAQTLDTRDVKDLESALKFYSTVLNPAGL